MDFAVRDHCDMVSQNRIIGFDGYQPAGGNNQIRREISLAGACGVAIFIDRGHLLLHQGFSSAGG
jgi:hypothetical protein